MIAIGAYRHRGSAIKVAKSRKGTTEKLLLGLVGIGFFLPFVWAATPLFALADYTLLPIPFGAGILSLAAGLWFLDRSHAALEKNWSITLEVRESHKLVTHGVYHHIRHPMYLALLLYSIGQALILPNWMAGPAYFVACAALFTFRVGPEERMMHEAFGKEYEVYKSKTKRLIPAFW